MSEEIKTRIAEMPSDVFGKHLISLSKKTTRLLDVVSKIREDVDSLKLDNVELWKKVKNGGEKNEKKN